MTERKLTPQERYDLKNTRRIVLKLNLKHDADVLAWIDAQETMQGGIKRAIREQIEREKDK